MREPGFGTLTPRSLPLHPPDAVVSYASGAGGVRFTPSYRHTSRAPVSFFSAA